MPPPNWSAAFLLVRGIGRSLFIFGCSERGKRSEEGSSRSETTSAGRWFRNETRALRRNLPEPSISLSRSGFAETASRWHGVCDVPLRSEAIQTGFVSWQGLEVVATVFCVRC